MTVRLKIAASDQVEALRSDAQYKIQPNGVLTVVVRKAKIDYRILREFAPGAWASVSGERFRPDTNDLEPVDDDDDYLFEPYDMRDSVY